MLTCVVMLLLRSILLLLTDNPAFGDIVLGASSRPKHIHGRRLTTGELPEKHIYGRRLTTGELPEKHIHGKRLTTDELPEKHIHGRRLTTGELPEKRTFDCFSERLLGFTWKVS